MKKILFVDSGSGELNILAHAIKNGVGGNFLYYADMKNLPYGEKSKEELQDIAKNILRNVYEFFEYEIVVFACNTLTTSAIDEMRKTFPQVEFVGVEPAIKPAQRKYKNDEILLMATERTLSNLNFSGLCVPNLPKLIDENLLSLENLEDYLCKHLKRFENKKSVVLGCTHYLAVSDIIKKILPNAEVIDSRDGVTRRLKSFAREDDYLVQIMSSGKEDASVFSKYLFDLLNS